MALAGVMSASFLAPSTALAEERDSFKLAWTIYAGWMPWKYADESGIMDKWADKYDIDVEITQIN
ncbi:MAG TPA: lipid kinase, partial [Alcanivorax sp.]|nr:lipid kinase [Alcanivorax sp.]